MWSRYTDKYRKTMRIIAGSLKGRVFLSPPGHKTHPMSEKIRGALFNMLGDIEGLTVFDAFAGSGAIAFEAISRGAKSAIASDVTPEAKQTMQQNASSLGIEKKVKIIRANTSGWCDNNQKAIFDIVVADPPYDDIQPHLLKKLVSHVKFNGLYVVSLPPNSDVSFEQCELLSEKNYGDACLFFYRRVEKSK